MPKNDYKIPSRILVKLKNMPTHVNLSKIPRALSPRKFIMGRSTEKTWGLEKITLSPVYFNSLRLKYALEALRSVTGKVLEVGSGAGAFVRAIKSYRPDLEIVGCDIDASLVKLARRLDIRNKYERMDVCNLSYKNASFDAVVIFDVLEHLEDPKKALFQIKRVLKAKGIIHLAIPLEANPFTIHGLFLRLGIKPKEVYAGHIKQFEIQDIQQLFKNAGFISIELGYSGHYLYQFIDFSYFLLLNLIRMRVTHTVEGYVEILPKGLLKSLISCFRAFLSGLCYLEAVPLRQFPGLIGHFTAVK